MIDLTLRCPTCNRRADMCFDHGDEWKKRDRYTDTSPPALQRMTEHELRAAVNEFTQDDPPPYGQASLAPNQQVLLHPDETHPLHGYLAGETGTVIEAYDGMVRVETDLAGAANLVLLRADEVEAVAS